MRTEFVTDLRDYNPFLEKPIPGSLREILSKLNGDPTTIKFRTEGFIDLWNSISVDKPNVTIDASGLRTGITFRKWQFTVANTHNIVLKNLRMRAGDGWPSVEDARKAHGTGGCRSLVVIGYHDGIRNDNTGLPYANTPCTNIKVVNCSVQNSTDDNASVWENCDEVLFDHCIMTGGYGEEGDSIEHPNSKAFLAGCDYTNQPIPRSPNWLTVKNCLLGETQGRAPDICGGDVDFFNNVIFDIVQGARFTKASGRVMNNYLLTKLNHPWGVNADRMLTSIPGRIVQIPTGESVYVPNGFPDYHQLHVSGNFLNGKLIDQRSIFGVTNLAQKDLPTICYNMTPQRITLLDALTAMKTVVSEAGCFPRDDNDKQVIERLQKRIGQVV